MSGWETTRLSKHFILLDFMADHAIYKSRIGLLFDQHWNSGYQQIAEQVCVDLLEPMIEAFGLFSVADAFWPQVIEQADKKAHAGSRFGPKHRWQDGEATVDIALWDLVDKGITGKALKDRIESLASIAACRDRVITYPNTEFACVTWKKAGAKKGGSYLTSKKQSLRAHHIRVGRSFCLLDFYRNAAALEAGQRMVPPVDKDTADYKPITQEELARACAALLDPLVARLGRVSVIRGIEAAGFASDAEAAAHHWDDPARPCRIKAVLPQGTEAKEAKAMLDGQPGVEALEFWEHPSEASALSLTFRPDQFSRLAVPPRGLRPVYD